MTIQKTKSAVKVSIRTLLASVGSYVAVYAIVALITPRLSLPRMDAVLLISCFAFPLLVAFSLWAFAESQLWKIAAAFSVPALLLILEMVI